VAIYANMHQSKSKFINGQSVPHTQQITQQHTQTNKNSTDKEQQHTQTIRHIIRTYRICYE